MIILAAYVQFQVTTPGNLNSITDRLWNVLEKLRHFIGSLNVKLLVGKTHPFRIVHRLASLDAEEDFVGKSILTGQVMAVIGRDQRQTEILAKFNQAPYWRPPAPEDSSPVAQDRDGCCRRSWTSLPLADEHDPYGHG